MNKSLARLAAVLVVAVATPAFGQATRTWVSGTGSDANPCSRTAPCQTFSGALNKTATGGEINCLDAGGFGTLNITKSISIDCNGTHGSILAANTNGVIVNGAGITVTLRNIAINGANTTIGNGVRILNAAAVNLDNVVIENMQGTGTNGQGVSIETSVSGVRVTMSNTSIYNTNNHGIHSNPGAGSVILTLDNVRIARGGANAVFVRGNTTATVDHSWLVQNRNGAGVAVESTMSTARISNTMMGNNAFGISSGIAGQTPTTFVYGSVITGNTTAGILLSGGTVTSLGNNMFRGNTGNEAPTNTITTQ